MGNVYRQWAILGIIFALGACNSGESNYLKISVPGSDADNASTDGGRDAVADTGPKSNLSIISCTPSHGRFTGGTQLTVQGTGFDKKSAVRVGGKGIQVGQTKYISPAKIVVVTPAGAVGPADVKVQSGNLSATHAGCFSYDPIYTDPSSGPTTGGTLVEIYGSGTAFFTGMKLLLGGKSMTHVEVIGATKVRAKTPAGTSGFADLLAGQKGGKDLIVRSAFRYYVSTNPYSGGLGGGPIKGTLTVSVLNWMTRAPVDDALVIVEDAHSTLFNGKTDLTGMVVFSKKNFIGPVNVTAGKTKFETTTVASFDARDVTIFLMPIIPPSPGTPPPGPIGGKVSGYVMFGGPTGVGEKEWKLVPEPKTDEVKRAYLFRSLPSIATKIQDPALGGTIDYTPSTTTTAWSYNLTVAPGMMAIYAVAGIYNKTTTKFTPYALGVTRGVVVGPGETKKNVNVLVHVPLKENIIINLKDVPSSAVLYKVRLAIDLGADGYIVRSDNEKSGTGSYTTFGFDKMPTFTSAGLVDASYTVDVALDGGGTVEKPYVPFVRGTMRSVQPVKGAITMDKFIGPATLDDPKQGAIIQNNTLTWTPTGAGKPNLAITLVVLFDSTPVWRIICDGQSSSVKLPDPKAVGLPEWPKDYMVWAQWLVHMPSYDYNKYNYNHLSYAYWDRWSQEQSYFRFQ